MTCNCGICKGSKALRKMHKVRDSLPKRRLDFHRSDSPQVTALKERLVDTAEKAKKEGIQ